MKLLSGIKVKEFNRIIIEVKEFTGLHLKVEVKFSAGC